MKILLYLAGLVVLSFLAWKLIVGANAKSDQIPDAPKATLDHVRDRTKAALDQTQQHIDDVAKQAEQSAAQ